MFLKNTANQQHTKQQPWTKNFLDLMDNRKKFRNKDKQQQ